MVENLGIKVMKNNGINKNVLKYENMFNLTLLLPV